MGKSKDVPNGYKIPHYWDQKYTKTGRRLYVGPREEHCFSVPQVYKAEMKGKETHGDAYVPEAKRKDGITENYEMPADFRKPDGWKEETKKGRKVYTSPGPQVFKCFSLFQLYVSVKKEEKMAKGKGTFVVGEVEKEMEEETGVEGEVEETPLEEEESFGDFGDLIQKILDVEVASQSLTQIYFEHQGRLKGNWAEISLLTDEAKELELELKKL